MSGTKRAVIDDFLAQKRIAFVGVSRNQQDFSRALFRELKTRGYDMIPVNPAATEIEGIPAAASVAAVTPPPDGVLVMTSAKESLGIVEQCAQAGVRRVWLHRSVAQGSVTPEAVEACDRHEIAVVAGECPFMFLPKTAWFHALHKGFRALTGSLPK